MYVFEIKLLLGLQFVGWVLLYAQIKKGITVFERKSGIIECTSGYLVAFTYLRFLKKEIPSPKKKIQYTY